MSKKIPLTAWAERLYDPPPSIRTLRKWVKAHCIRPEPELMGREYRVDEDAVYVSPESPLTPPPPESDPVVYAIWRRQA